MGCTAKAGERLRGHTCNARAAAQIVAPVISRHKQVETCLECSAKKLSFVGEVFYYAIKAVVYPVAPLFDVHAHDGTGAMRPRAIKALKRIFLMCDRDKVGAAPGRGLWRAGARLSHARSAGGAGPHASPGAHPGCPVHVVDGGALHAGRRAGSGTYRTSCPGVACCPPARA